MAGHRAMFIHLSMPSPDAACFSTAGTAALGDEPQVCGGGGGFYRLQWTIPASTAIPGQLLRFDGALDNLPGSCCFSHESTDLIRPGMVPGTLCSSCNTQSKLCVQGGLRVSWGMSERFSTIFINTRTTQGLGYFIRKGYWASKRVLWPTDIGPIPGGVRSHCWDPPTALPLNQLDAGAGP